MNLDIVDRVDTTEIRKPKGPPNRMNDLPYKEWMKFQKSFFRFKGMELVHGEFVNFFTKEVWKDGMVSKSLICGFEFQVNVGKRIINTCESYAEFISSKESEFDYVGIDLTKCRFDKSFTSKFLKDDGERLFFALSQRLKAGRYCCLFIKWETNSGTGFPSPWSIASFGRNFLKLRDEKIGLDEATGDQIYCLIFQNEEEKRKITCCQPNSIATAKSEYKIPSWVIPKPAPRKKHELLHPAKYPETLVQPFIELFSKLEGKVFDPMLGTGSTIIAALKAGRSGYGIELGEKWASIARERLKNETQPLLFSEFGPQGESIVANNDARNILKIKEFKGIEFDYVVTSPPYWSMLSNKGSENQQSRRERNLDLTYSEDENDFGNIASYDEFLKHLADLYNSIADKMSQGAVFTIIVKNIKREHTLYTFAWDLVDAMTGDEGKFNFIGNTLWCQDDIGMKPFAVGIHWVSNIVHQYCLHFQKR